MGANGLQAYLRARRRVRRTVRAALFLAALFSGMGSGILAFWSTGTGPSDSLVFYVFVVPLTMTFYASVAGLKWLERTRDALDIADPLPRDGTTGIGGTGLIILVILIFGFPWHYGSVGIALLLFLLALLIGAMLLIAVLPRPPAPPQPPHAPTTTVEWQQRESAGAHRHGVWVASGLVILSSVAGVLTNSDLRQYLRYQRDTQRYWSEHGVTLTVTAPADPAAAKNDLVYAPGWPAHIGSVRAVRRDGDSLRITLRFDGRAIDFRSGAHVTRVITRDHWRDPFKPQLFLVPGPSNAPPLARKGDTLRWVATVELPAWSPPDSLPPIPGDVIERPPLPYSGPQPPRTPEPGTLPRAVLLWRRMPVNSPDRSRPNTRPAVGPDGTLYVVDQLGLHAIAPDGAARWSLRELSAAGGATVRDDGVLLVGGRDGTLYFVDPEGRIAQSCRVANVALDLPAAGPAGGAYVTDDLGNLHAVDELCRRRWFWAFGMAGRFGNVGRPVSTSDGRVFVAAIHYTGGSGSPLVHGFSPHGRLEWRCACVASAKFGGDDIVVGPDGTLIVRWNSYFYHALRSDATFRFSHLAPGGGSAAIAPNGTVYFFNGRREVIEAKTALGAPLWTLLDDWGKTSTQRTTQLSVTSDGLVLVTSLVRVLALGPDGTARWERPGPPFGEEDRRDWPGEWHKAIPGPDGIVYLIGTGAYIEAVRPPL